MVRSPRLSNQKSRLRSACTHCSRCRCLLFVVLSGLDTAPHLDATSDLGPDSTGQCWIGEGRVNTCPNLVGGDPVTNYMNWIDPDCSEQHGVFTAGQAVRMEAQYEA